MNVCDFESNERVYTVGAGQDGVQRVLWWCVGGFKAGQVLIGHPRKGQEPIVVAVPLSDVFKCRADAEARLNPANS